jgi:hypothetical protein
MLRKQAKSGVAVTKMRIGLFLESDRRIVEKVSQFCAAMPTGCSTKSPARDSYRTTRELHQEAAGRDQVRKAHG